MFQTLKSHAKAHKALIAAVIVSLLLHTLFFSEFSFTLPDMGDDDQPLNVQLVQAPSPAVVSKTIEKITPKPKPEKTETASTESAKPVDSTDISREDEIDFPATDDIDTPLPQAEPEPVQENVVPASIEPSISEQTSLVLTPLYIETEFDVFQGESKSIVGSARITFNIDKSGSYSIKSTIEAQGITALFFQNLVQESQGSATESGLKPNYYSYRYGNKKSQTANFHWDEGTLTLRTEKGERTEKLETGTQDLLSFMYQFMFAPPQETNAINITNGKTLRNYNYRLVGEEIIYSKFGTVNAIHLTKSSVNNEEKTELWLAIDYKNLPIKIRKTEKNGSVIEQVATIINTDIPIKP